MDRDGTREELEWALGVPDQPATPDDILEELINIRIQLEAINSRFETFERIFVTIAIAAVIWAALFFWKHGL